MEKKYSLINNITGWAVFIIASVVYLLTIEPTVSLWDCGEFIASANKLEVGHPPGAPFFLMLARFFAIFAGENLELVAKMVNSMSALSSSFTILFLFWTITHIAKKFFADKELSATATILIMASGTIGALAYTFSDTFWFSAVEGEVYALSSLFTAVVFWAILKWENVADEAHNEKWIVLIAYLMGLSIGVHLLNLLAIPAIAFVYYFRKYKVTRNGILVTVAVSAVSLSFVLWGIISGSVKVASKVELFTVNTLGLPFNSGLIVYLVILMALLIAGLYFSHKENKVIANTVFATLAAIFMGIPFLADNAFIAIIIIGAIAAGVYFASTNFRTILNLALLVGTVIIIGYSSYAMIVVRSLANPPMDENNPDNVFALLSYLNREQYGDRPLLFGPTYNAPLNKENPYSDGKISYVQKGDKYVATEPAIDHNYDDRFMMFFPRMYSTNPNHIKAYKDWADVSGKRIMVDGKEIIKPTFGENLTFFFSYQINFMYWRYFMWNFAGRQNDEQSHGDLMNGNWISGIDFIDNMRLGDQSLIPDYAKDHPSRNTYYFLPLLLGLAGAIYSFNNKPKEFTIVGLLFFLTGIAIVLYLNQTPYQPRERDYAYAGSFYAFAIWIGLGTIALFRWIEKYVPAKGGMALAILLSAPVPYLLATENWKDHDRSGRYLARDFAYNHLITCAPNSILFTNGDNDTFPLWYIQEVEEVRTDVRVACLPLMSTDWYGIQMQRRAYESAPLPISMPSEKFVQGTRDYLPIYEKINKAASVAQVMDFVEDDSKSTKVRVGNNTLMDFIPTRDVYIDIDSAQAMKNNAVWPEDAGKMEKRISWKLTKNYILKNEMFILDMLSDYDWSRPFYYSSLGIREMMGLDDYFVTEGYTKRFTPINQRKHGTGYDTRKMYDNLMHKYRYGRMNEDDVHLCHHHLRNIKVVGLREMFSNLAYELVREGKRDSAVEVLDKCMDLMQHPKVPYDFYCNSIADAYYRAGAKEKASALVDDYVNVCIQEIRFFTSLTGNMRASVRGEEQRSMAIAGRLMQLARMHGDTELADDIEQRLNVYVAL